MAGSNCTFEPVSLDWSCVPFPYKLLFWVISAMLVLSITLNIFSWVSKRCSGKGLCKQRTRRRLSSRQMEDNPIYGNIGLITTSTALFTGVDPTSQSSTQDCYANLTLKPPRPQSGRSSPQIQYSDVVHLEQPSESEKEDEGNPDFVSNVSDLYASVQNQRTKTVNPADSGDDYANHL
ncbi:hypothetical protein CgunFtcFv8_014628 [Champsocephalus gunnari]|uniref:Uncharacterized protein n=1 Tax=Champsocephalus gunnari TaxID=52237 RepID=A0AAN8EIM7_CHAGU|nr:hypothetical protein CgunFtcFv8_014628 [Champsocephalus gunnari]